MKVYNEPQRVALSEYENATSQYVDRVEKANGVLAILTMGSVGAPGLSDIDIIVVVDDNFSSSDSKLLSTQDIDDKLFLHGPVVIPKSLVSDLQFLIYASNLKVIWGAIDVPDFSLLHEETRRYLSICYLLDFAESRFQQYADLHSTGSIDKRAWLTRIWSVTHTYDLFKFVFANEVPVAIEEKVATIKKPREDWLRQKTISNQDFLSSLNQAEKLNNYFFIFTLERVWGKPRLERDFKVWTGQKKMQFSNKTSVSYNAKSISFLQKKIVGFELDYPAAYLAHLSAYDDAMKVPWLDKTAENKKLVEVMRKRYALVKTHSQWLSEHAKYSRSMSGYIGMHVKNMNSVTLIKQYLTKVILK